MNEPVLMNEAELKAMRDDMKKVVEANAGLKRDLEVACKERDDARGVASKSRAEADRLGKLRPSDKIEIDNKGLRSAVSESHKKIATLEKELVAAKAESEARRKEVAQVQQRISSIQSTFDMMQVARNEAQAARDKAIRDLQDAADVYHKLQGEFNDFKKEVAERESESKKPKAKAQESAKA